MEIYIRPGIAEDLPELISLQSLSLSIFYVHDYETVQIAALIESQAEARKFGCETILVAEIDRKIVGFASLSNLMPRIDALYVHPDWMRRGIGKQLLASIEEIAIQRRCHILRVIASNAAAFFYQSQGYEIKRPFAGKTRSGEHIPCQFLEKRLLPSNAVFGWMSCHPLIILLLLSLWLGIIGYYFQRQNTQFPEDRNIQPQYESSLSG